MSARRRRLLAGLTLLLAAGGCAGGPSDAPDLDAVPRPEWRVGDRWVFRRTAAGAPPAVVTHQVTAASGDGYTMRVSGLLQEVTRTWTADLHLRGQSSGDLVTRFEPPAPYFAWPLALGKEWRQALTLLDGRGPTPETHLWRVGPVVERVDVLVGTFYAVRIEHWRGAGERLDTYWYSPRVRYWIKLESYLGGYAEELVEFALSQ